MKLFLRMRKNMWQNFEPGSPVNAVQWREHRAHAPAPLFPPFGVRKVSGITKRQGFNRGGSREVEDGYGHWAPTKSAFHTKYACIPHPVTCRRIPYRYFAVLVKNHSHILLSGCMCLVPWSLASPKVCVLHTTIYYYCLVGFDDRLVS